MPVPGALPAPWGRRLLAFVIDQAAALLLGGGFLVAGLVQLPTSETEASSAALGAVVVGAALLLGLGVFQWWYQGTRGFTIGKRLVGLRTLSERSGRPVGMGPAFVRLLVPGVANVVPGVGPALVYASPLFDSTGRRQGWHDKAAGTVVLDVASGIDPAQLPEATRPDRAQHRLDSLVREASLPQGPPPSVDGPSAAPSPVATPLPSAAPAPVVAVPLEPSRATAHPVPVLIDTVPGLPTRSSLRAAEAAAAAGARVAHMAPPPEEARHPAPAQPDPILPGQPDDDTDDASPTGAGAWEPRPAAVVDAVPFSTPSIRPTEPITSAGLEPDVEATRLRPARGKVPEVPPGSGTVAPTAVLELTDGRRINLSGTALIGRNPAPRPGERADHLIAVPDPARSVSKTHLLIGVDRGGVYVKDRDSTNGTVVTLGDGQQILCGADQQVRLPQGASIAFGDYGIIVADVHA